MLTWQIILLSLTLIYLLIATYTDLKKREVPDWISYGLIFTALNIRLLFSIEYGWSILITGLIGLAAGIVLAYVFYLSGQWGGGDSKLLMGIGASLGLDYDLKFLLFFFGLLIAGAIFGFFWCLFLAVKNKKSFWPEFKTLLKKNKAWHWSALALTALLVLIAVTYNQLLTAIIPFPLGLFYLLCLVKAIEKTSFVKLTEINRLVEGDWLAEDIDLGSYKLPKKVLEKKDIRQLLTFWSLNKVQSVKIREGIPFVPCFLLAYFLMMGWSLIYGK